MSLLKSSHYGNYRQKPVESCNVRPNNQSCTEKGGDHYASFVHSYAPLVTQRYRQITMKKVLCNKSMLLHKTSGKPCCAVAAAVGKKAHHGTKQCQAVKELSPQPFSLLSYTCTSVSRLVKVVSQFSYSVSRNRKF